LHGFVPFAAVQLHNVAGLLTLLSATIALDQFSLAVFPAVLSHLLDCVMRLQFRLRTLFQLAMKSLVVRVQLREQAFRQEGSGQTLSDYEGIIP
jgi:hypothetical protein